MKVYCFGEKEKPVIFLFPGTCCHWKGNFGKVIEPLEEYFRVACVSYDGFDETEQTEFPTMTEETEKIEQYIKKEFGGHICAAYGCSLGGSFVGLLAARGNIHMEYGILGGSDLDQSGKFLAKLMTKLMMPVFYPFIANGEMKIPFMKKKMDKMLAADNGYIRAFMDMIKTPDVDMSHITKRSVENQFYSDLITPLPDQIDPSGTQIHILYALKMGEKYRARYKKHFAGPILHELDLQHEELLAVYPDDWVKVIAEICNRKQGDCAARFKIKGS